MIWTTEDQNELNENDIEKGCRGATNTQQQKIRGEAFTGTNKDDPKKLQDKDTHAWDEVDLFPF